MQMDFSNVIELPRTKPTLALESCADFFDRDYGALAADVQNRVIKFSWDIATEGARKKEIRIYAQTALAFFLGKPIPKMSEEDVYKIILPNRDIRSTELERILACSHQHVHAIKTHFTVTREPVQEDGPNSFTVFDRQSIVNFLKARRLS